MTLELKLKKAMLISAIDIIVKGANKSPERCARNLIELGVKAYPNTLTKSQQKELYTNLLGLFKDKDISKAKDLFFLTFNHSN